MGTHPIFESDFDCLTDIENFAIKMNSASACPFIHTLQTEYNRNVTTLCAPGTHLSPFQIRNSFYGNTTDVEVTKKFVEALIDHCPDLTVCGVPLSEIGSKGGPVDVTGDVTGHLPTTVIVLIICLVIVVTVVVGLGIRSGNNCQNRTSENPKA